MAVYKTVSIKEVLGRIYRNIKPVDSSWENDIYEWLWEGMEKTRVRTSLQPTSKVMIIKDYQTNEPLPCGLMVLDAVLYNGARLRQSNTVLNVPKINEQFEIGNNSITGSMFEINEEKITVETTDKTTTITTKDSLFKYNVTATSLPYWDSEFYKLVSNKIQTSFKEGEITIYYLYYETDNDGIITIPDNEALKTALYWYVLTMMIGAGFEHPIFKYQDAEQRWEDYRDRAINSLRNWTPDRAYDFSKTWVTLVPTGKDFHNTFLLNRR